MGKVVTKIALSKTLTSMTKGEVKFLTSKQAKTNTIRQTAIRIKSMSFEISEKDLVDKTKITRLS